MREIANPWTDWLRQRYAEAALALALGLGFALMGPYSTDEQAFLAQLGFWAGLLACWYVASNLVETFLQQSARYRTAGPWTRKGVLIACTSAPMILAVAPAVHAMHGWEASVVEVIELYWKTALIGCIVVLLSSAIIGPSAGATPGTAPSADATIGGAAMVPVPIDALALPPVASPAPSRLMSRLPSAMRGRLLCLQMEDHYVRVHTDRGSTLVLLRLGDAIAEAAPFAGGQVHRSWWVAGDAVAGYERTGRTGRLTLTNGLAVPVSQRRLDTASELTGALAPHPRIAAGGKLG